MANYERQLSTTVNDVEHVESMSIPGLGIAKIYFQPDVDIRLATAEVTALSQYAIGSPINLEADVVARYVQRLLEARR